MEDADLDRAAQGVRVGRFFNCGQACLATKRIYVHEAVYDAFKEKLIAQVQRLKVGDGMDPASRMGPMHSAGQRAEVEAQVKDALDKGAKVAFGGGRPEGDAYAKGNFINPVIVEDVPAGSRMLTEEVFGPALPLVKIKDIDEGIRLANDSPFGLGSSIWTKNMAYAWRAINEIDAGYTWVNDIQIAYDELPFGGTKQSGFGKEHGTEAFLQYTEAKSVVIGGLG
jgi:succinate-semialdehyde dehydrogenase/glutarate-semialdehyde dehydrogenase